MMIGDVTITNGMLLAFIITVSWVCSLIATIVTKDSECLGAAVFFSVLAGIGFLCSK